MENTELKIPIARTIWHLEIKQPKKCEKKHHYHGSLKKIFTEYDIGVSYSKVSKECIGSGDYEIETDTHILRKGKLITA